MNALLGFMPALIVLLAVQIIVAWQDGHVANMWHAFRGLARLGSRRAVERSEEQT